MTDQHITNNVASEAGAVADIVRKHVASELLDLAGGTRGLGPDGSDEVNVLVLPTGLQAHSVKKFVDEYRSAPERRKGTAKLLELESLVIHVNRFKDQDSALFAQPSASANGGGPSLTAVLDYHRANVTRQADGFSLTSQGAPRFGEHRAVYTFPLSDQWAAWLEKNGKPMDQSTFATWLEDRIVDVADPEAAFSAAKKFAESLGIPSFASPTKLLGLSRGLTIHVDERATAKIDPSSGETTIFYQEEHKDDAGAPLAIPRAFLIQIPVFREGDVYQFPVRLKYRHAGGRISWSYEIHDLAKAFDDAFRGACARAAESTALPLFYGTPE